MHSRPDRSGHCIRLPVHGAEPAGKGGLSLPQARRSLASVAVELAFRRFLQGNSIRFTVMVNTPFTNPDRYDISIDGRRCELVSYLFSHQKQVSLICQDPGRLLQAPALVASDEFTAEYHRADDLYLFAFLLGLDMPVETGAARLPYWIHLLPREWCQPAHWRPLKPLTLKNESAEPVSVELGGQDGQHQFLTARVEVPPKDSVIVEVPFYTLAYVHALEHPSGLIRLHSPTMAGPEVISSSGWASLWIEAKDLVPAGWLSHEEFRRRASLMSIGSATLQFDRTRVKNRAVSLTRLEPMSALLKPNLAGL